MTSRGIRVLLLTLAACGAGFVTAAKAAEFSPVATYLFFAQGQNIGKSEIKLSRRGEIYVFDSTTKLQLGEEVLDLAHHTELDRASLRPRLYSYGGKRFGESFSGTVEFERDSAKADIEVSGLHSPTVLPFSPETVVFQNYVPEHLLVIAERLAASEKTFSRLAVLFPSDMMVTSAIASLETEMEMPIQPPVVCSLYSLSLKNSPPFYLYYDREHKSLLYMDFPATKTEIFLQSAWGEHPKTKYARTAPAEDRE